MASQFSIEQSIDLAWRRKWFVVVPALAGVVISLVLLQGMQKFYTTAATVTEEKESQQLDVRSKKGSADAAKILLARIQMDDFAIPVARKVSGLAEDQEPDDWTLERVRNVMTVEMMGDLIYFRANGKSPEFIAKIANAYAEQFVQSTREKKVTRTGEYATFYGKELAEKRAALDAAQKRLAAFREANRGALPEQIEAYAAANARFYGELSQATSDLEAARQERDDFQRMLLTMPDPPPAVRAPLDSSPAGANDPSARLRALEARLADLRTRLTDKHPDIQAVLREIESTKSQIAPPAGSPSDERVRTGGNLLDIARIGPAYYTQLQQMNNNVRRLQGRVAGLQGQVSRNESKVSSANRIASEYMTLTRELKDREDDYKDLKDKSQKAALTQDLTADIQGEIYTILERAPIPLLPYSPQPLTVLLIGLAIGASLGVGVVTVLEMLDQTYKSAEDLTRELGIPVVATITRIEEVRNMGKKDTYAKYRRKAV